MSEHIHKSHNVSKLMYHFVFPTKYRRVVVSEEVDEVIKETCEELNHHRLEAGGFGLAAESSLKLTNLEVIALLSFF